MVTPHGVQSRRDAPPEWHSLPAGLLLFVPVSLLGNGIAAVLRYPDIGSAVLFPPYAALTAALVVSPRRHWIWYVLAGAVTHLAVSWPQWPLSWVLWADTANVARAMVAAALLLHLFRGVPRLDGIYELALFIAVAVIAAPAVGASIGAANVWFHGGATSYWHPWSAWFISNALTGLALLPASIPLFGHVTGARRSRIDRPQVIEALALTVALAVTCMVAFASEAGSLRAALPLYAPVPILIWAALRFGTTGASAALTVVALAAIWSVDRGTDPFRAPLPEDNVFALQAFVLFTTVTILCLAAVATARHQAMQLYGSVLASLQDQVAVLNEDGIVLDVNESWRRFAATAHANGPQRMGPGDDYLSACESAAASGDRTAAHVLAGVSHVLSRTSPRFEMQYEHERDGGRDTYILAVDALERSEGGAVVTRSDVTARRQAQSEIDDQRHQLSHLARVAVLGQLSGAFAHELNQPLTGILSNAEAARQLLRRPQVDTAFLDAIVGDIAADSRRAAAVIERLRALMKRGDRRLQPVDAAELVRDVLELARTELITRHVHATAKVAGPLPPLWGDRIQLQQVLLNLIVNGCDAMSTGAKTERRLTVSAGVEGPGHVHLAVCDSGTGIPPALIDRLFEPFVTTKSDGLGLGLSICRTIVTAHGGRLWAENNADRGASIHCVLPAMARASASADALSMPEHTTTRSACAS